MKNYWLVLFGLFSANALAHPGHEHRSEWDALWHHLNTPFVLLLLLVVGIGVVFWRK